MLKTTFAISLALSVAACDRLAPQTGEARESFNVIAEGIVRQDHAVDVMALSERIVARRGDYLLLDIRSAPNQGDDGIRTAEASSSAELLSTEGQAALPQGRDIILYSETSDAAAQTATLLRLAGVNAYFLSGGHRAWKQQMRNVSGTATDSDEAADMARQQAVACWFEGDYVAAAGLPVKPVHRAGGYMPPLQPVAAGDTLGLGLGLGLGDTGVSGQSPKQDSLGLGLDLGLGPAPKTAKRKSGLLIGEGC